MKKIIKQLLVIAICSFTLSACTEPTNNHTHKFGSLIGEVPATCVEDGMKAHYECSECGQLFDSDKHETTKESLTIEKLGHLTGITYYEDNGYHYHMCERCGARTDVELHTLSEVAAQEADHNHTGVLHHYHCGVCEMDFLDAKGMVRLAHTETNTTGHDVTLTYHPEVPATCEASGTKAYYSCSCGALFEDAEATKKIANPVEIPALGHLSNGVWHSDDYKHWHVCNRCHEVFDEVNHTPGNETHQDLEHSWKLCSVCGHKVDIQDLVITGCHHARLMHYDKLQPTLSKPGHIEYYYCCDCHKSYYDSACTREIENTQYGVSDMRDGRYLSPLTSSFNVLNQNLRDYLNAKTDQEIVAALRNNAVLNYQAQKTILWEDNRNTPYQIEVSKTRSFDNYQTYTSNINSYTFDGTLMPGETYYYRVKDSTDRLLLNDLSFKVDTTYSLRTITVPGMHNVRDLGGWTAKDGHKVFYGKLYRGGSLSGITEEGKETFLDTLGIKTEIDLRRTEFDGGQDLFDSRLSYNNCGIWMYTQIIPGYTFYSQVEPSIARGYESYVGPALKQAFEILADENNYPVYFHCSAGADRTGTFAYLVNGLLGVSYEDLVKDFELTSFSVYGNRYRSAVNEDNTFSDSGIFQNDNNNWVAFGKLNEIMMADYANSDMDLCSAIENYLKTECGISDQTIAAVRRNLLGEGVSF